MIDPQLYMAVVSKYWDDPAGFITKILGYHDPLAPWQQEFCEAVRNEQYLGIYSCQNSGKSVHKLSTFVCKDGSEKLAKDIVVGDVLVGRDGGSRTVTSIHNSTDRGYCWMSQSGCERIYKWNHELVAEYSRPYRNDELTLTCDEYASKNVGWKARTMAVKAPIVFNGKDPDFDPILLGLWLGDGHSSVPIITNMDEEVLEYLETRYGEKRYRTPSCEQRGTKAWTIYIHGHMEMFKKLGVLNNKHIPKQCFTASVEYRRKLLGAIMSADFSKEKTCDSWASDMKKTQLAKDIVKLARQLGLFASIHDKVRKIKSLNFEDVYSHIQISGDVTEDMILVKHKKPSHTGKEKRKYRESFKLIPIDEAEFVSIEVDGDHQYMTPDGFVEHNSTMMSCYLIWALLMHPHTQIVVSGATESGLNATVVRYIKTYIQGSKIAKWFQIDTKKVTLDDGVGFNRIIFANWSENSKSGMESFQGKHVVRGRWDREPGKKMRGTANIFFFDEASSLPQHIYEATAASIETPDSRLILAGNPLRANGPFFDSSTMKHFYKIHINGMDLPYRKDDLMRQFSEYAENSTVYRARVLGLFPTSSDDRWFNATNTKFPQMADETKLSGRRYAGLDIARGGLDESVLVIMDGNCIVQILHWSNPDTQVLKRDVTNACVEHNVQTLALDGNGVGASFLDWMQSEKRFATIAAVIGNNAAFNLNKYYNRRTELYGLLESNIQSMLRSAAVSEPTIKKLREQLLAQYHVFDVKGRFQMVRKELIKDELDGESPDFADALSYCMAAKPYADQNAMPAPEEWRGHTLQTKKNRLSLGKIFRR